MKIQKNAFTLTEILVVIAVIGMLALGVSQINLSRISQNELLATEVVRLVASMEEMRNNAIV
jgi:prepilin-type N-terminal cleavage/methylation domain-containing protein